MAHNPRKRWCDLWFTLSGLKLFVFWVIYTDAAIYSHCSLCFLMTSIVCKRWAVRKLSIMFFYNTWSNLIQWIRDLIVRWQSDLVNTKGVFLVCVKRDYTNLKNIRKLNGIEVCRTMHWKMLTVQVWHSLSKFNHMFKIQFFPHIITLFFKTCFALHMIILL